MPEQAPLRACQVLEQEYEHLYGPLPPDYPRGGTEDQREAALRRLIHALPERRTALCLSGGGIRSATFGLGVLQGLAERGWLARFHYLSTVSGGGYVGSWLSSWIHRESLPAVVAALGAARASGDPEPPPVRRLRAYSNYLSPVWGLSLDFVTLISTFLRNLLLHWTVLVPLLLAALLLPRVNRAVLDFSEVETITQLLALVVVFVLGAWGTAYATSDLPGTAAHRPKADRFVLGCFLPIFLAAVLMSWTWAWHVDAFEDAAAPWRWYWYALAGALLHAVGVAAGVVLRRRRPTDPPPGAARRLVDTRASGGLDLLLVLASGAAGGLVLLLGVTRLFPADWLRTDEALDAFACLAVPFLLGCFWLGTAVYAGLANRITDEGDREWWARSGAWWILASVGWIVANALVIYGPRWALAAPTLIGSGGLVGGLVSSLVGYWNKQGPGRLGERGKSVLAAAGRRLLEVAALAFIVVLLLALCLATSIGLNALTRVASGSVLAPATYATVLRDVPLAVLLGALVLCAGVGVGVSALIGANTFSLHAMYGNRLVRAYLGATRSRRHPHRFTGFDPDDNLKMAFLAEPRRRLFHVVNAALNLVRPSGDRLEWQQRKATSFTVSALHAGSRTLAYQPTESYAGGFSLGRALTISGAAAAPNMGYHSSPLVGFVMAFLNARLGWWLPNPDEPGRARWARSEPRVGVVPLLAEALSRTTDSTAYVYLTDGGHFENLGLYEMVARRCHAIVVVDAGCDPTYLFEDLENAVRKIRVDLGVPIEFPGLATPEQARATHRHFVVGRIGYSAVDGPGTDGVVVLVKPLLSGDEPVDVRRYAETHAGEKHRFPQQSTADQFFDEAQFESYRELGRHSVTVHFPAEGAWPEAPPPTAADPGGAQERPGEGPTPAALPRELATAASTGLARAWGLGALPGWVALASVPLASWFVLTVQAPATPPALDGGPGGPATSAAVVVVPELAGGRVDRVMLPFFAEAEGCQGDPRRCAAGVKLDTGAEALLGTLTRALADCVPVPGRPIAVEVRGYASSSEFSGGRDSGALNLALANLRATTVAEAMERARRTVANGARLRVSPRRWPGLDAMVADRRYVDNQPAFTDRRGALNRRVDVVFEDLGRCEPRDVVARVTR